MGRTARGVRGIDLREGDAVVSALVPVPGEDILTVALHGYGKRTELDEYRQQGRGGLGLINLNVSERTGPVVAALSVLGSDEVVVATRQGMVIRTPVEQDESNKISRLGRATQGVRVIRLKEDDEVVSVTRHTAVQEDAPGSASGAPPDEPEGETNA
jgi:DNA gyrase subunit A